MPIYTPGRRRAILLLLLTSALLLTLDLRGTAILDTAREGFQRAMEPFEAAADVVTRPVRDAWRGIMDYEELQQENLALKEQLDGQLSDQVAGRAYIQAYQELLALNQLPSLSDYNTVTAAVEGQSPGNLDQIIEINKGRNDGIEVGMAVVNAAGLVGKITAPLLPDRAFVLLITDPKYVINVKVLAPPPPTTTTTTIPGPPTAVPLPGETTTTSSSTTTTSTTTSTTSTTLPPLTEPLAPGETTSSTSSTTTIPATTTTNPQRDTGRMSGQGPDRFPQIDFLQDTPTFGRPVLGDVVLTAGGTTGLAPPDIPVGTVGNVIARSTADGPLLEVTPLASLDELQFVRVVLYKPTAEVEPPIDTQAGD
ncbi:MAG: rod shape-determining protein MreC [Ilumatobacteraceae bacterium]